MLLAELIPFLDLEIDRLQRARDLLAYVPPLANVSAIARKKAAPKTKPKAGPEPKSSGSDVEQGIAAVALVEAAVAPPVVAETAQVVVVKPYDPSRRQRPVRRKQVVVEDTALRGSVPAGPVVVSANEARRSQALKAAEAAKTPTEPQPFEWRVSATETSSMEAALQRLMDMN